MSGECYRNCVSRLTSVLLGHRSPVTLFRSPYSPACYVGPKGNHGFTDISTALSSSFSTATPNINNPSVRTTHVRGFNTNSFSTASRFLEGQNIYQSYTSFDYVATVASHQPGQSLLDSKVMYLPSLLPYLVRRVNPILASLPDGSAASYLVLYND